jgi:hypothetical protein
MHLTRSDLYPFLIEFSAAPVYRYACKMFRSVLICCILGNVLCRLKNLGKGMLQPHQIIAEYNNAIPEAEREKLKDGAFEDVLRAAQVCTRFRDIDWTAMLLTFDAVQPMIFILSHRRLLLSHHGLPLPSALDLVSGSM